jgi:hypothetical protein
MDQADPADILPRRAAGGLDAGHVTVELMDIEPRRLRTRSVLTNLSTIGCET